MKRIASILFIYLLNLSSYSHNYYVSSSSGNDNNNGRTPGTSWANISKDTLATGKEDIIVLKGGDEFYGAVTPPSTYSPDYYVSKSGTGSGDGSIGDPLDFTQLQALTLSAGDIVVTKFNMLFRFYNI